MNSPSFKHFIITAFNIDIGERPRENILDIEYLSKRLKIFKDFCYPSIRSQTNQNFSWLVFFDEETPHSCKEIISELQQQYNNFCPIYTHPQLDAYAFLVKLIYEKLSPLDNYLITTWLDNDDTVANDFIEQIQAQFCSQDFEYINFPYGYDLSKKGLFLRQHLANQFLSLIEKIDDNIITCKVMSHHRVHNLSKKGLPVRQIIDQPMWVHLRHESNVTSTTEHPKSIPQPLHRLNNNFVARDFIKDHIQYSYLASLTNYLQQLYLSKSPKKLQNKEKLGNILALIKPEILQVFLSKTLESTKNKNLETQLSVNEIKSLCLKQGSDRIWIRK